jgi:hypothetical protein
MGVQPMKPFCTLLLAALFWGIAMAALPAEPAVRCKLELVTRPPLPKDWQEAKKVIAIHCVDSQEFARGTEKGITFIESASNFTEIVKKEPQKYVAKRPFRGVAKLGSKQYAFVLDDRDKESRRYDRLYFDLNGNGDLTDDKPIDLLPSRRRGSSETVTYDVSEFPRVVVAGELEGRKIEYPLSISRQYVQQPDYEYVRLYLQVDAYRRGEITLDGKKHTIAILDWNSNGRFDDLLSLPKNLPSSTERILVKCGDMLLIDPEKRVADDISWSRPSGERRQFLSELTVIEGKYYRVKVSPAGDELTWTPVPVPCGQVTSPHAPCRVDLISETGWLDLSLQKSKPTTLPAGQWRLRSYSIPIENWKKPEQPAKPPTAKQGGRDATGGSSWFARLTEAIFGQTSAKPAPPEPLRGPANLSTISANGSQHSKPVLVEAGKTTSLRFGPPYRPEVAVERWNDTPTLALCLRGADGEVVNALTVNGRAPAKPTFTITDPKGTVVAEGDFEYG